MSSTCFEPEGSSSGRRLYTQLRYSTLYMHQYKQSSRQKSVYRGADKSLARPTSRYILFDGENISFDASLVIYI